MIIITMSLGSIANGRQLTADNIRIQYVHSDTEYPQNLYQQFCDDDLCNEQDAFSEAALRTQYGESIEVHSRLDYRRNTESYSIRIGHFDNEANFRGDLGFVSRVDRRISVRLVVDTLGVATRPGGIVLTCAEIGTFITMILAIC